jgi:hypothetical protein
VVTGVVGLWPLAYWDCGFESRLGHGCLSLVSVVCCQVEVSVTSWSLVQRSSTECGVSKKCVLVKPQKMRRPRPPRGCRAIGEKKREWRSLCNVALCDLYSSPNITQMIKSRTVRSVEDVAHMGDKRGA